MSKSPLLAAAAALAVFATVSVARADDPPPTKPAAPPPTAPTQHESKITPEAKAAYEKMEKAANHATGKEIAGTLTAQVGGDAPTTTKFTVKGSGEIKLESADQGGGGGGGKGAGRGRGQRGGGGARGAGIVLRFALGSFRPVGDPEYDAEIAKKDGKDVLTVTMYKAGEVTAHTDYVLDANGLFASAATTQTQTDKSGQKKEFKTDYSFDWTKSGDTYRLDKLTTTGPMGTTTFEISYVDAGGFSVPSGWQTKTDKTMYDTHVLDLVVDGKKIETPALAPKPDAKDGGKKDKDGDGDEKK